MLGSQRPERRTNTSYRLTVTLKNSLMLMYWNEELIAEKQLGRLNTISPAGTWIIGQEQDTILGGFEADERVIGSICGLQMWKKGLNKEEVSAYFQNSTISHSLSMFNSPPSYTYELKDGALFKP